MKAFTDRLRRCSRPLTQAEGRSPRFKPVIGLSLTGGGGSETCTVMLQKVLKTCGFEPVDMVPARRQNFPVKLQVMEVLGRWSPQYVTSGEWERVTPRSADVR